MTGHKLRDGGIALYDCTGLSQIVLPPTHDDMDRTSQLIDLFFQYRYYKALKKPAHDFAVRSSPNALAEAWTWFVRALLVDQDEWFGQLKAMKQDYHEHGIEAMKMEIHQQSIKEDIPCCVRRCQKCPMCYKDSQKSGDATREGHKGVISDTLRSMIFHFDKRWIKYDADAEEEEARDRAIQEDIIDDTCFAQIDQGWIQQQIRNVESETYGIKSQNNVLQRGIKSLIRSDTRQRIMIKDLQDDLDDLKQLVKDAGIERRARKS
ncbi:hypothetical protein BBJ28_00022264 [Nothophytophthora sp. Chile5]|nr:hypothetical protein BBJ28_00022264 [Nothophytophthora sp. Chile5]